MRKKTEPNKSRKHVSASQPKQGGLIVKGAKKAQQSAKDSYALDNRSHRTPCRSPAGAAGDRQVQRPVMRPTTSNRSTRCRNRLIQRDSGAIGGIEEARRKQITQVPPPPAKQGRRDRVIARRGIMPCADACQ
jgi:hypothetical protein